MASTEDTLAYLGEDDRERFHKAVGEVGHAFESKTGIAVDPQCLIENELSEFSRL